MMVKTGSMGKNSVIDHSLAYFEGTMYRAFPNSRSFVTRDFGSNLDGNSRSFVTRDFGTIVHDGPYHVLHVQLDQKFK